MTGEDANRRQVLKQIGATSVLGTGGLSSVATATPSNSSGKGPVRARGQIQLEYEYTPDALTVEEWYVSPDLDEHYGSRRMRFNRYEYDRSQFPADVDESLPERGKRVSTTKLDRRVGTGSEWAEFIESKRNSGGVGVSAESDYSGPIWEYDRSDDGYYSQTAPVNVVWETNYATLGDVVSEMKEGAFHGLGACAQTKYVYILYEGFVSQDAQVGTQDYCGDAQHHVRLWRDRGDFGSFDGQFEIGSAHHDPAGHNFGCCCDSFDFEKSENYVRDYWRNNSTADTGYIDLNNSRDWSSDCKESNTAYGAYVNWY